MANLADNSDARLRKPYGDLAIESLIKRSTSDLEAEIAKLEAELAPAGGKDLEPYRSFTDGETLSEHSKAHIDELLSHLTLESEAALGAREAITRADLTNAISSRDATIKQLQEELSNCKASHRKELSDSKGQLRIEQTRSKNLEDMLASSRSREKQLVQEKALMQEELDGARATIAQNEAKSAKIAEQGARLLEQREWLIKQVERTNAEAERRMGIH